MVQPMPCASRLRNMSSITTCCRDSSDGREVPASHCDSSTTCSTFSARAALAKTAAA